MSGCKKRNSRKFSPSKVSHCTVVGINTLHVEIIYTSPFINAEIKFISVRSK